ncbi:hypothetical protein [Halogeometricum limi]|uniref:Uncharacterized protein n=1 Tax=Halogeometricum limi TaxID=555875 RepID=A0A1I6IET1_9EURY|nr:hypothetical protein [Halogeometricum limi]SFR65198.1 hypothetical protein SAMN04488124_3156 [Halogeometricum limi]
MSESSNGTAPRDCELEYFERNHYFHGKLMTPRDMEAQEAYHDGRLRMLARDVLGSGVVRGLAVEVEAVEGTSDITVTVSKGVALDCCGTPVVVEGGDGVEVSPVLAAEGDNDQYLYLKYDDCKRETVPVPGGGSGCGGECEYNRILEKFEIVAERVVDVDDPHRGPHVVEEVEFPKRSGVVDDDGQPKSSEEVNVELLRLARAYHETHRQPYTSCTDPHVYLCRITPTVAGETTTWSIVDDGLGQYVYSNELLYAAIARHAAAFDNPHETTLAARAGSSEREAFLHVRDGDDDEDDVRLTSAENQVEFEVTDASTLDLSVPGVKTNADNIATNTTDITNNTTNISENTTKIGENTTNITTNTENIENLTKRVSMLERYVLDKTLKYKISCFERAAEAFNGTFAQDVARKIVARAEAGIRGGVYRNTKENRDDRAFHVFVGKNREEETFEGLEVVEDDDIITVTENDHEITIDTDEYRERGDPGFDVDSEEGVLKGDFTLFDLELLFRDAVSEISDSRHDPPLEPSYEEALRELRDVLNDDEAEEVDVAVAQDLVCETVEWLRPTGEQRGFEFELDPEQVQTRIHETLVVSGFSSRPRGTTVRVRISRTGDNPLLVTGEGEVGRDSRWRVEFPVGDFERGTYEVRATDGAESQSKRLDVR